jgi:outer membrane protein assembly factor BamB
VAGINLRGWLALVAIAAAGVATGLWGVGGAGALVAATETTKTTNTGTGTVTTTTVTTTTTETTPSPSIFSFGPSSGPPGTMVVIRGTGFTGATAVRVNGTVSSFTVDSDSSITATVPDGATSGSITVETPAGTASTTSAFTVTATVPGQAVAYQINAAHDGVQTDAALNPPYVRRWVANFANPASYPLIAASKVFVTVSNYPSYGGVLYALDQTDGHVVWSQAIPGTYSFSGAAYDTGRVFVVNFDGLLRAFDAATGAQAWSTQLPVQYAFTSPPVAGHGAVYVGGAGSGGTVYAVDEQTGQVLATRSVANGDHSSPALSDTGVFVGYACNQVYGLSQTSLALRWHYSTSCSGGGGKTTVYANGDLYTRDYYGNLVLTAGTGTLLSSYSATRVPAVDSNSMFVLSGQTLAAESLTGGSTRWTFGGDGQLITAPIVVVTPFGEFVIEGSYSGRLYVLDAATGAQVWSTNVGAPIPGADEQNATILQGLAAGQGLLVVPAGNTLTAYTGQTTYTNDTTPPTITVPADITTPATSPAGAAVSYTASASDPDDAPAQITLTCLPSSGSTFPVGTTTVTCNAHDQAGNNAVPASFSVTVLSAAAQLSALRDAIQHAAELQSSSRKKLLDKLMSDLNQAGQQTLSKACQGLARFITDVKSNTAPRGPITTAHSSDWISAANNIRAARGC